MSYRDCGLALLRASSVYERVPVDDLDPARRAVVALGGRCRRLLRAAYCLADRDEGLEGQILIRVMLEYAITIKWLLLDPELHFRQWAIRDIRRRFALDSAMQRLGQPALFDDAQRAEWTARLEQYEADCGDADTLPPPLEQQAVKTGDTHTYGLAYRYESQVGAHPTPLGVEAFIERDDLGHVYVVGESTFRVVLDVYAAGVVALLEVLAAAGNAISAVALGEEFGRIGAEVTALAGQDTPTRKR